MGINSCNLSLKAMNQDIREGFNNIIFEMDVTQLIDHDRTTDSFLMKNQYVEAGLNYNSQIIDGSNWESVIGDYKSGRVTSDQRPFYKNHWCFTILKRKLDVYEELFIRFGDSINNPDWTVSFFLSDNDFGIYKDYLTGRTSGRETMKCSMLHFLMHDNRIIVNERKDSQDEHIFSSDFEVSRSNIQIIRGAKSINFALNDGGIRKYRCVAGYKTVALGISGSEYIDVEFINKISITQKKSVIYLKPIDIQGKGNIENMNMGLVCKGNPLVQFEKDGRWIDAGEALKQSDGKLQLRLVLRGEDMVYKCFLCKR